MQLDTALQLGHGIVGEDKGLTTTASGYRNACHLFLEATIRLGADSPSVSTRDQTSMGHFSLLTTVRGVLHLSDLPMTKIFDSPGIVILTISSRMLSETSLRASELRAIPS